MTHLYNNGLDHSIGFHLGIVYRKASGLFQNILKEYDITPEQWSVLLQVCRSEGLIQKDIAERLGKDRPTVTRLLDQLEGKGMAFKKASRDDRRSFLVYATDQGRAVIERTLPLERQLVDELKSCMTAHEHETFMALLQRLGEHISEISEREGNILDSI